MFENITRIDETPLADAVGRDVMRSQATVFPPGCASAPACIDTAGNMFDIYPGEKPE